MIIILLKRPLFFQLNQSLDSRGGIYHFFPLVFLEILRLQQDILKSTDLYMKESWLKTAKVLQCGNSTMDSTAASLQFSFLRPSVAHFGQMGKPAKNQV